MIEKYENKAEPSNAARVSCPRCSKGLTARLDGRGGIEGVATCPHCGHRLINLAPREAKGDG